MQRKKHEIQIIEGGVRYIAIEKDGKITLSKDGNPAGTAEWRDDQMIGNAMLPDNVVASLERILKERMDANWDED